MELSEHANPVLGWSTHLVAVTAAGTVWIVTAAGTVWIAISIPYFCVICLITQSIDPLHSILHWSHLCGVIKSSSMNRPSLSVMRLQRCFLHIRAVPIVPEPGYENRAS